VEDFLVGKELYSLWSETETGWQEPKQTKQKEPTPAETNILSTSLKQI